jgi:small-conductance mechanosensitive channel
MSILSLLGHAGHSHAPGTGETLSNEAMAGVLMIMLVITVVAATIVYLIMALSLTRIFKKAGVQSWKAWVPVYNVWIILELGGQKGYWAALTIIPVINIAAAIFILIAMHHIGRQLGKEDTFVLIAIFFPLVWYIWLAVDKSTWQGKKSVTGPSKKHVKKSTP